MPKHDLSYLEEVDHKSDISVEWNNKTKCHRHNYSMSVKAAYKVFIRLGSEWRINISDVGTKIGVYPLYLNSLS